MGSPPADAADLTALALLPACLAALLASAWWWRLSGRRPMDAAGPVDTLGLARQRGRAPRGKAHFRPQLFYQRVLPEHMVPVKLEIRMGMSGDGVNLARLPPAAGADDVPADGDYARSQATFCDDAESEAGGDGDTVGSLLAAAATWGDAARIRHILSSCYCTLHHGSTALAEAAAAGHVPAIEALLEAGAPPLARVNGKCSLQRCESQEAAQAILRRLDPSDEAARAEVKLAAEAAQAAELGRLARCLREFLGLV